MYLITKVQKYVFLHYFHKLHIKVKKETQNESFLNLIRSPKSEEFAKNFNPFTLELTGYANTSATYLDTIRTHQTKISL